MGSLSEETRKAIDLHARAVAVRDWADAERGTPAGATADRPGLERTVAAAHAALLAAIDAEKAAARQEGREEAAVFIWNWPDADRNLSYMAAGIRALPGAPETSERGKVEWSKAMDRVVVAARMLWPWARNWLPEDVKAQPGCQAAIDELQAAMHALNVLHDLKYSRGGAPETKGVRT